MIQRSQQTVSGVIFHICLTRLPLFRKDDSLLYGLYGGSSMPIRERVLLGVIVILLLSCSLLIWNANAGRFLAHRKVALQQENSPAQPTKTAAWYLTSISASPDGVHLAVKYAERKGATVFDETMRYGVAIYNLKEKKYTTKFFSASYAALRPGERAWSIDGKWFAYSTVHGTRLVSHTGAEVSLPDTSSFLLWSPDTPTELFCLKESSVIRYDITAKRAQPVRKIRSYVDVFPVNGKACMSETYRDRAVVRELVTGKQLFTIPYYDYAKTDGPECLEVSPDGHFFLLDMYASGWSFAAVARVQDAGELLRKEHLAIFWQEGISGNSFPRVLWPHKNIQKGHNHPHNTKYLYLGSKAIDINTGSRGDSLVGQEEDRICIERWPGYDGYLIVTGRGLYRDTANNPYPPDEKEPPVLPLTVDNIEIEK